MKLCSDVSSRALLSIHFITELQYHDLVTSPFTVGKKKIQENLQKLHFKIWNTFTKEEGQIWCRKQKLTASSIATVLLWYWPLLDSNVAQGKSISRIKKNRSLMAPTALKKMWCRSSSKAKRSVVAFRATVVKKSSGCWTKGCMVFCGKAGWVAQPPGFKDALCTYT